MRINLIYRLLFVAILLTGFWLRVADLDTMPPGLHYDEGENLQRSWRLIQGYGFLPNFEGIPEPFDAYIRAAFLSVTGVLPFNARLYTIFLNLLGIAATIAAARALYWKHPYRDAISLTAGLTIAALPPFVMIGRGIYASNWIPFTTMMAVTSLVWAWRTNKSKYFMLAGIFPALALTFYLAGLAFFGTFVLLVLLFAAYSRFRWPTRKHLIIIGISALITLIPWFTMFLWIPDWMTQRLSALTAPNLSDPTVLVAQIQAAIQPIFVPNTVRFPVYTPYTVAFLNPALFTLFAIGLLIILWSWRKPLSLVPLVILAVMIVPNILSNVPEQPIRMSGIYGPLALLTGLGAGEVLIFSATKTPALKRVAPIALSFLLIATPIITFSGIAHHFRSEQRLLDDPTDVRGWAFLYRQGYLDLMQQVAASTEPIYIPIEQLNSDLATVVLRSSLYPTVRPHDGRALPAGTLMLPTASLTYGLPEVEYTPLQYALVLPTTREILILPALPLAAGEGLQRRAQNDGADLVTSQGWHIGKTLPISSDNNPFETSPFEAGEPLAVFDNRLELLAIDAPPELTPGQLIPVTLHWRLREGRGQDYFVRLQLWDYNDLSRGTQNDKYALMFRYLYPPVMWTPGEVVTETRWIHVFDDAPPGGYRFAISVNTYPGPKPVSISAAPGISPNEWALVGQSAVSLDSYLTTEAAPETLLNAAFEDQIRLLGATRDAFEPGASVNLQLAWQAVRPIGESYTIFVHIKDQAGNLVAQQDIIPFDGQYPTWAWSPGATFVTTHTLTLPADSSGPYTASIGLYRYPSLERLLALQDGVRAANDVIVLP